MRESNPSRGLPRERREAIGTAGAPTTVRCVPQFPKKIHLIAQAYLAAWTRNGRLQAVHVRYGPRGLRSPAEVGWRKQWWGDADPELNTVCEEACGKLENKRRRLLPSVVDHWPPSEDDRVLLAQFMALHVVRTDGFRRWYAQGSDRSLDAYRAEFTDEQFRVFANAVSCDRQRSLRLLAMQNKISSVLASMHWSLLEFDEPLLVASDQPICPVALMDAGTSQRVAATPCWGWIHTVEVRFVLSPQHALVATWHEGPETAPHSGTWEQASNINGVVIAQTEMHWMQVPNSRPAVPPLITLDPTPRFETLSPTLIPGYSSRVARTSELRLAVEREVDALIEGQNDATMTVVRSAVACRSGELTTPTSKHP